jgi:hypothetical protein
MLGLFGESWRLRRGGGRVKKHPRPISLGAEGLTLRWQKK